MTDPAFHGTLASYDVEVFIPVMTAPSRLCDPGAAIRNPALVQRGQATRKNSRPDPDDCVAAPAGDTLSFHTMAPAPNITLHVPGPLRAYCGGAVEIPLSVHTVRAALEDLERRQPTLYRNVCDETGAVRRHLNVFVNSDHIRDLEGIDTKLTPGDVLTILPAVSGG